MTAPNPAPEVQVPFVVSIGEMRESNGKVTYSVCIDRPDRKKDAMPWDEGRITPYSSTIRERVTSEAAGWQEFLRGTGAPAPSALLDGVVEALQYCFDVARDKASYLAEFGPRNMQRIERRAHETLSLIAQPPGAEMKTVSFDEALWQVVPREPTPDMQAALSNRWVELERSIGRNFIPTFVSVYADMLSAAPPLAQSGTGVEWGAGEQRAMTQYAAMLSCDPALSAVESPRILEAVLRIGIPFSVPPMPAAPPPSAEPRAGDAQTFDQWWENTWSENMPNTYAGWRASCEEAWTAARQSGAKP